jgi:hypothetical protein
VARRFIKGKHGSKILRMEYQECLGRMYCRAAAYLRPNRYIFTQNENNFSRTQTAHAAQRAPCRRRLW